tara:strand:- start:14170 stop:14478 length:309 start_codon:yes stop_codon:yes gene_type:complete
MVMTWSQKGPNGRRELLAFSAQASKGTHEGIHLSKRDDGMWVVFHDGEEYVMPDRTGTEEAARDFLISMLGGSAVLNRNEDKPYIRFIDHERGSAFDVWTVR